MGTYFFNYKQPDYGKYIRTLFDNTKEGILTIAGWYYDTNDETENLYKCHLNWDVSGREKLISDFSELYSQIETIASIGCRKDEDSIVAKKILGEKLFIIWDKYIRIFDALKNGRFSELCEKEDNEELTKEEKEELLQLHLANVEDAKSRFGDNPYAYNLVCRAQRLHGLLKLKAPMVVISSEAKTLLEVLLLYRFCTDRDILMLDDLGVEELENAANEFWIGGGNVNADSAESLRFALKAVEKGSNKMYKLLARLYSYGIGEDPSDYVKSAEYYELALEKQEFKKPELEKKQIYEELMALYWHPEKANDLEKALKYRELYLSSKA